MWKCCSIALASNFSFCLFCLYLLLFSSHFHSISDLSAQCSSCAYFYSLRCGFLPFQRVFGFSLLLPADAKMAADDPSKKSSKIVWRTCVLCSTRLSELCYDTHSKCETCRGKVCSDVSFCSECESWSPEFRKLYLKHKKSLLTKRVSKQNRRASKSKGKSPNTNAPTPSDDAASVASQESHVTPPVV